MSTINTENSLAKATQWVLGKLTQISARTITPQGDMRVGTDTNASYAEQSLQVTDDNQSHKVTLLTTIYQGVLHIHLFYCDSGEDIRIPHKQEMHDTIASQLKQHGLLH